MFNECEKCLAGAACLLRRYGSTALRLASARLRNSFRCGCAQRNIGQCSPSMNDRSSSASAGARASAQFVTQAAPSRQLIVEIQKRLSYIFLTLWGYSALLICVEQAVSW
jgi:hypothetical protein